MDKQQTDIATYRLNWPKGRFSENIDTISSQLTQAHPRSEIFKVFLLLRRADANTQNIRDEQYGDNISLTSDRASIGLYQPEQFMFEYWTFSRQNIFLLD